MAYKFKIRIILWLLFAVFFAFLLNNKIVPTGHIFYFSNFIRNDYFISKITPNERIYKKDENAPTKIIGDPVYFTLRTPRKFKEAKLTVSFQIDDKNIEEIKTGVLVDKTVWRYELKPLYNRTIENLSKTWNTLSENGLILLQKENKFKNIDSFVKNLPDKKEIALYDYSLPDNFIIKNYVPAKRAKAYPLALRGSYEFYVYIKDETMDLSFDFSTLNKNKDQDNVDVNIYQDNKPLGNYHLTDNNTPKDNGETEGLNHLKIERDGLPEGVYKIEVKANDDVITNNLTASQSKLSFINKIWVYGNVNQTNLFTDSPYLSVETTNPGSLQDISFGSRNIKLSETYQLITASGETGIKKITFAMNDILLAGNGVFALSAGELIDPSFTDLTTVADPDKQGIKYILARYEQVKQNGDDLEAETDIDLVNAYQENNKYSFIISVPGLDPVSGNNSGVNLVSTDIELSGNNLWSVIKRYYSRLIKK